VYEVPRSAPQDGDAMARRVRALARVRKLLRLARDQAGLPEGEAARARADAILLELGLQMGALELAGDDAAFTHRAFALGEAEPWRRALIDAIADYFDCTALFEKNAKQVETFGPEHLLPHLEYVYVVYVMQLRDAWLRHVQDLRDADTWDAWNRRQQLDARAAFCNSFSLGVKERLTADRQRERTQEPALWAQSQEQRKQLDRWMRQGGVRWRGPSGGVGAGSTHGYQAGLQAEVDPALRARHERRQLGDRGEG
jgi:hypothetical protein